VLSVVVKMICMLLKKCLICAAVSKRTENSSSNGSGLTAFVVGNSGCDSFACSLHCISLNVLCTGTSSMFLACDAGIRCHTWPRQKSSHVGRRPNKNVL